MRLLLLSGVVINAARKQCRRKSAVLDTRAEAMMMRKGGRANTAVLDSVAREQRIEGSKGKLGECCGGCVAVEMVGGMAGDLDMHGKATTGQLSAAPAKRVIRGSFPPLKKGCVRRQRKARAV